MPSWVPDVVIVVVMLGMTYALSSEGVWGAALMFFNLVFAGIIAFNFYEPLAGWMADQSSSMAGWADMLCLMGLFVISLIILRVITDMIAPAMTRLPTPVYHLGRLLFGFAGSCVAMAIILCGFETAPVHRKMFGVVDYQWAPPFHMGLDHKWLAFMQYTTGYPFGSWDSEGASDRDYEQFRIFDPKGSWLIDHQNARPYHPGGELDTVPSPEFDAPAAPSGGDAKPPT